MAQEVILDAGIDWLQEHYDDIPPPRPIPPGPPYPPMGQKLAFSVADDFDWGIPLVSPVDPLSSVLEEGFDDLADVFGTAVDAVGDVVDGTVDWLIGIGEDLFR
jgi:hypothetical protein